MTYSILPSYASSAIDLQTQSYASESIITLNNSRNMRNHSDNPLAKTSESDCRGTLDGTNKTPRNVSLSQEPRTSACPLTTRMRTEFISPSHTSAYANTSTKLDSRGSSQQNSLKGRSFGSTMPSIKEETATRASKVLTQSTPAPLHRDGSSALKDRTPQHHNSRKSTLTKAKLLRDERYDARFRKNTNSQTNQNSFSKRNTTSISSSRDFDAFGDGQNGLVVSAVQIGNPSSRYTKEPLADENRSRIASASGGSLSNSDLVLARSIQVEMRPDEKTRRRMKYQPPVLNDSTYKVLATKALIL